MNNYSQIANDATSTFRFYTFQIKKFPKLLFSFALIFIVAISYLEGQRTSSGTSNWSAWLEAAGNGTNSFVSQWSQGARFQNTKINGHLVICTSNCLVGPKSSSLLRNLISREMARKGAPKNIAYAFERAFLESWEGWYKRVTIPGLKLFPEFQVVCNGAVKPTVSVPVSLWSFKSSGLGYMNAGNIERQIKLKISGWKNIPHAEQAIKAYAKWLSNSFHTWNNVTKVKLIGSGTVSGFSAFPRVCGTIKNGYLINSQQIMSSKFGSTSTLSLTFR